MHWDGEHFVLIESKQFDTREFYKNRIREPQFSPPPAPPPPSAFGEEEELLALLVQTDTEAGTIHCCARNKLSLEGGHSFTQFYIPWEFKAVGEEWVTHPGQFLTNKSKTFEGYADKK